MLKGKTIIVTGAARGLGQGYCIAFAGMGANIVAADISSCEETKQRAGAQGGRVIAVPLDVTKMAAAQAVAEAALAEFGRIDGLVNNAALYGALRGGKFDAIDEKQWDAAMAVNVKGIWHCCKAVAGAMRSAGKGSIVNIASLAATYGMPYALHYTTSKAAVIGLTRASPANSGATTSGSTAWPPRRC